MPIVPPRPPHAAAILNPAGEPDPALAVANGALALDALLQHRTRLGICVLLSRVESMAFTRLRDLLDETDGNLGAHLRKLEDAGYIRVRKEFVDRKPISWYMLTDAGQRALRSHLDGLEALLSLAQAPEPAHSRPGE